MTTIKNHIQLIGRLGANPEIRILDNGSKVARFNIAINESYTNKQGERVSDVQWHTVVAWGNLATIAEKILQKGTQVTVDGRLNKRSYNAKDGSKRIATEVVANELFVSYLQAA